MKGTTKKLIRSCFHKLGYQVSKLPQANAKSASRRKRTSNKSRNGQDLVRYIHIGMPKCASTSLQREFFPNHSQLLHLGSGYLGNFATYIDDHVKKAVELSIINTRENEYDENEVQKHFQPYFEQAKQNQHIFAVGLSCECLSFSVTNCVDNSVKARRLEKVFGSDAKIIMIVRAQKELFQSSYAEMVRQGYVGDFVEYLEYCYEHRYRSVFSDCYFDKTYQTYAEIFGSDNIKVIPYELLEQSPSKFIAALCESLGVEQETRSLSFYNNRLSKKELYIKKILNQRSPHGLGKHMFSPSHTNFFLSHFEEEMHASAHFEAELDHKLKVKLISLARELADNSVFPIPEIDLSFPKSLEAQYREKFTRSNAELAQLTGLDLSQFGYWT